MSLDGIKKTRSTREKEQKASKKESVTHSGKKPPQKSSRNPYMQFFFTKLGATVLVVVIALFGYFLISVRGDTTVGVTIATNPELERGLIGHWTFDGSDVNPATTTTTENILDRSGQGNHGNMIGF